MNLSKDFYSVVDVANLFSVSPDSVYREIGKGKLVGTIKFGSKYSIPKSAILKYVEDQMQQ